MASNLIHNRHNLRKVLNHPPTLRILRQINHPTNNRDDEQIHVLEIPHNPIQVHPVHGCKVVLAIPADRVSGGLPGDGGVGSHATRGSRPADWRSGCHAAGRSRRVDQRAGSCSTTTGGSRAGDVSYHRNNISSGLSQDGGADSYSTEGPRARDRGRGIDCGRPPALLCQNVSEMGGDRQKSESKRGGGG
ncbi:hypothetical protein K440DRAFT_661627 [Wilcoxina mikolae CBS 423.85]|nr:hypothetical protein K440DRAFT_661627 [Wilcoxina mikolae CBS 423.85]